MNIFKVLNFDNVHNVKKAKFKIKTTKIFFGWPMLLVFKGDYK